MKTFTLAVTLALYASSSFPAAAGPGAVNLPHLTFPDPVVTPSTKSCVETASAQVCQIDK